MRESSSWRSKLMESLSAVLITAVVARVAWELLAPVVPLLLAMTLVLFVLARAAGRRSRW